MQWIRAAVFPPKCVICGAEAVLLCHNCRRWEDYRGEKALPYIEELQVAVAYNDTAKAVVEHLKYYGMQQMRGVILPQIEGVFKNKKTVIVPIPLHWTRQLWRGFNQSLVLSEVIAETTHMPIQHLLQRKKRTKQQAKLSRKLRRKNLENAFCMRKNGDIPSSVTIVDDVCATGETLISAAKTLKEAGVKEVRAIVFARPNLLDTAARSD